MGGCGRKENINGKGKGKWTRRKETKKEGGKMR